MVKRKISACISCYHPNCEYRIEKSEGENEKGKNLKLQKEFLTENIDKIWGVKL
jgi:hypothetical protein